MGKAESRSSIGDYLRDPNNPTNAAAIDDSRRQRLGLPPRVPFSQERATRFIHLVAATTITLDQIAQETDTPVSTFFLWTARSPEVMEGYARAREAQMHLRTDEIMAIADDSSNDWVDIETRSGRMVRQFDHEHAKRSDMRIRTRMWLMTRFARKTFGDRLQLDAGQETLAAIAAKPAEVRLAEARELIARARRRVAEAFACGEVSEAECEDVSEEE